MFEGRQIKKSVKGWLRLVPAAFLFICLALPAHTQYTPDAGVEKAILDFHLNDAWYAAEKNPSPELREYYKCRILLAKLMSTENQQYAITLKNLCDHALTVFGAMKDNDPHKLSFMAETHALRGVANILRGDLVAGGWELNTACRLIHKNETLFPGDPSNKKLLGLFHVAFGTLPKKYDWLAKFLCTPGETGKGLEELKAAGQRGLMQAEAEVILFFIEKSLLGKPADAHTRISQFSKNHPGSFLLTWLNANSLLGLRRNDECIALMNQADPVFRKDAALFLSPYWEFTKGLAHAYALQTTEAESHFNRFRQMFKGRTFRADATFRAAMMECLRGNNDAGKTLFANAATLQASNHEADEYAMFMGKIYSETPPGNYALTLYKARNLFDGGYYQKSIDLLLPLVKEQAKMSPDEKTELHYRLGRNYQETGNTTIARVYYNSCRLENPDYNLWMKVYCHYYLGKICQEENRMAEAENFYRTALSFRGYLYESGLQQKCKGALNKMNKK